MNSVEEKRAYPRAEVKLEASLETGSDALGKKTQVVDLAARGARFFSSRSMSENATVKVTISTEDREIVAEGKVIWSKPTKELGLESDYSYVWGIKFTEMDASDAGLLAAMVKENL